MEIISAQSALGGTTDTNNVKTPFTPFAGDSILSLKIGRTSTTGTPVGSFPVPIFGAIHEVSDYSDINLNIPPGYTLAITRSGGNEIFTYSDGTNEIEYTLSCSTLSYRSALTATLKDSFKVGTTQLSVTPEGNAAVQFSERVVPFMKNIYGGNKSNPIDVGSNQNPVNNLSYIILVAQTYKIDKDNGVIFYMDSATTALTIILGSSTYVQP